MKSKPYIHVTQNMTGKMHMMISVNDSSLYNPYCKKMSATDLICGECYSIKTMKRYKTAEEVFKRNGDRLSERILQAHELPRFNAHTVRLHAHGELRNETHAANLFLMCSLNPRTNFTLWTKRSDLIWKVIRDFGKPSNLILVYSSPEKNKKSKRPVHFDKVFTGWTKEHKGKNYINCGHEPCIDCMKCYDPKDRTIYINEIIK